jgi:chromate reductase, NAD(P)H dehydrogenase (quinone)
MSFHIVGFSGSLRRASYNTGLLRTAAEVLPEDVSIELFDLAALPFYNQDDEAELPAPVRLFKERIELADALLIASPEYNYSFTGVLKNAIDWASRPRNQSSLTDKPIAIMGAGGRFGTVRSQLHLRQVLVEINALTLSKPELMVTTPWEKFDKEGNLTDEATRKQLAELIAALVHWARRVG